MDELLRLAYKAISYSIGAPNQNLFHRISEAYGRCRRVQLHNGETVIGKPMALGCTDPSLVRSLKRIKWLIAGDGRLIFTTLKRYGQKVKNVYEEE